MTTIRTLRPNEIECRIGRVWSGGFSLLLYKDARCDMAILDETFGPEKWQRAHREIRGTIYCGVGILTDSGWVWKWDAGAESKSEPEKGQASDAFKRACVNWGIGRELYSAPFVAIQAQTIQDGKFWRLADKRAAYGIKVEAITYNTDRQIDSLWLTRSGETIYQWRANG